MDDRLIFTVGSAAFNWSDVAFAAKRWGMWDRLERTTAEGIASAFAVWTDGPHGRILDGELEATAEEFRYRRDLLSADELTAWLDTRGLDLGDWREHIARVVGRERAGADIDELLSRHRPSPEEIASKIEAEGLCSGAFGEMAERLAGLAACWDQRRSEGRNDEPDARLPLDDRSLDAIEAAHRSFVDGVATDGAIAHEVGARSLDWIRISGVWSDFADEETALEAAMCVRQDGLELVAAAARAKVVARPWTSFVEDAGGEWQLPLVRARPGDLVGPIRDGVGFGLLHVLAKVLPGPTDPDVRERASASLVARAVERAVNDRVVWHAAL
jgi:hypothetical protein